MAPDLAATSVFLDFDGTITRRDTGVHLLERLADPAWRAFEAQYVAGTIGSRECLLRQWETLSTHDEATLRAVADEVAIDDGFVPLVEALRSEGAEVVVVSDGYGFHAERVCATAEVPVVTNVVDFATGALVFPNADPSCPCANCGTCKRAPITAARQAGRTTVLVGDGASDRHAARAADVVFAKDGLAEWCDGEGVAYEPFETLDDVGAVLVGSRR